MNGTLTLENPSDRCYTKTDVNQIHTETEQKHFDTELVIKLHVEGELEYPPFPIRNFINATDNGNFIVIPLNSKIPQYSNVTIEAENIVTPINYTYVLKTQQN